MSGEPYVDRLAWVVADRTLEPRDRAVLALLRAILPDTNYTFTIDYRRLDATPIDSGRVDLRHSLARLVHFGLLDALNIEDDEDDEDDEDGRATYRLIPEMRIPIA